MLLEEKEERSEGPIALQGPLELVWWPSRAAGARNAGRLVLRVLVDV